MTLALFFSRGVSLKLWIEKGIFDREKLLYEEHLKQNNLSKVYWLTYGMDDKKLADKLKQDGELHQNIEVIQMPSIFNIPKIGGYIYSIFVPFFHSDVLKKSDIYKTNQTDGGWSAVIAKKIYAKKLLYRTGYTMSQLENNLKRFNIIVRKVIELAEKFAYKNCDKAIVASKHNKIYVINKYKLDTTKVEIIYNFIDRDRFYDFKEKRIESIVFVGRLSDEKNISNLIKSAHISNISLDIYGSGPLKEELEKEIRKNNYNVRLKGNVANSELPKIFNRSKYCALVSKHEGMPKALIEGMACGCVCIGTNVSGINEVIKNDTGILAKDTSTKEISIAINKAIKLEENEYDNIKYNMSNNIDDNFTLSSIVEKEKILFKELFSE